MKIVTIVVNYNGGALLGRCVEALLKSTTPIQLYVVDNHSTDNSLAVLRPLMQHHDNLEVIENDANLGFARANNQVLQRAEADYFALINPDCIVEPTTLETICQAMEMDPRVGLASCLILNTDGSVQKTCRRRFPTPLSALVRTLGLHRLPAVGNRVADFDCGDKASSASLEYVEAVSGALMVMHETALREVGPLDEGYFMHCEDLDWCMRVWNAGYRVGFVTTARAIHHKGGSGRGLLVNWHLHRGMLRFYRKHYRLRYPVVLMWLVYAGVAVRFVSIAIVAALRSARARLGHKVT